MAVARHLFQGCPAELAAATGNDNLHVFAPVIHPSWFVIAVAAIGPWLLSGLERLGRDY